MICNIAAFGDSWIYGDEIEHPDPNATDKQKRLYREANCTVGQLGKLLGVTVENYGVSGNSLQGTVWEFYRWLNDEHRHTDATPQETLVVVGLTESIRESWWNGPDRYGAFGGNYVHNHTVFPEHPWHKFVKHYYTHCDDKQLQQTRYWQTTEFFHNWCQVNGSKLLMFNIFPPPYLSDLVTHPSWNMRGEVSGDMLAPGKHANEKGSVHLANHLQMYAKSIII
jgi:hypothetical protein